jgi:SHS2 domain-containing protein
MSYEILDHTADVKFRAIGPTMEDAFKSATEAFSELVGGDGGMYRHKIEIESENQEALLFDYLDELILLQELETVVVSHAKELEITELKPGYRLEATVLVDNITGDMELLDIKAPTYNEMVFTYEEGKGWVLEAVLDI